MSIRDEVTLSGVAEAPQLRRVVVAIDPAATSEEDADETGIVVAGVGNDGHAYVLDDLSGRYAPLEWAQRAIGAYRLHRADPIVAESNNGGEMVENTIRMVDPNASFKAVHASRGKVIRAEPVAALYEQNKVHHVGALPALEDQMCAFTTDFERGRGSSPDRVDALVWALTELMVEGVPGWGLFEFYRRGANTNEKAEPKQGEKAGVVTLRAPPSGACSHVYTMSGNAVPVRADGTIEVSEDDAKTLTATGWALVAYQCAHLASIRLPAIA